MAVRQSTISTEISVYFPTVESVQTLIKNNISNIDERNLTDFKVQFTWQVGEYVMPFELRFLEDAKKNQNDSDLFFKILLVSNANNLTEIMNILNILNQQLMQDYNEQLKTFYLKHTKNKINEALFIKDTQDNVINLFNPEQLIKQSSSQFVQSDCPHIVRSRSKGANGETTYRVCLSGRFFFRLHEISQENALKTSKSKQQLENVSRFSQMAVTSPQEATYVQPFIARSFINAPKNIPNFQHGMYISFGHLNDESKIFTFQADIKDKTIQFISAPMILGQIISELERINLQLIKSCGKELSYLFRFFSEKKFLNRDNFHLKNEVNYYLANHMKNGPATSDLEAIANKNYSEGTIEKSLFCLPPLLHFDYKVGNNNFYRIVINVQFFKVLQLIKEKFIYSFGKELFLLNKNKLDLKNGNHILLYDNENSVKFNFEVQCSQTSQEEVRLVTSPMNFSEIKEQLSALNSSLQQKYSEELEYLFNVIKQNNKLNEKDFYQADACTYYLAGYQQFIPATSLIISNNKIRDEVSDEYRLQCLPPHLEECEVDGEKLYRIIIDMKFCSALELASKNCVFVPTSPAKENSSREQKEEVSDKSPEISPKKKSGSNSPFSLLKKLRSPNSSPAKKSGKDGENHPDKAPSTPSSPTSKR